LDESRDSVKLGSTISEGIQIMATKPAAKKPAAKAPAAKKAPASPTIPMSKLIAELAEKHGLSKKSATELFNDFVELTVKNLKKGNKVRLTGLGILQVRKRAARMGRNPATGEAIKIKASKKVAFRVAKDLKEAI
jgi:DNA-binding protein HU-beta